MVQDGQIICSAVDGGYTCTTNQIENMSFSMCGKINVLLQDKTANKGCKVHNNRVLKLVHMHVEITHQPTLGDIAQREVQTFAVMSEFYPQFDW